MSDTTTTTGWTPPTFKPGVKESIQAARNGLSPLPVLTRANMADNKELHNAVLTEYAKTSARNLAQELYQEAHNPPKETAILSLSDLQRMPKVEWWIDGIIPKGADVEFAAPGGLGKSFLALHSTLCLASGMPWFRRDVQKARVLYVLGEGASGFGQRASAWLTQHPTARVDESAVGFHTSGVNLSNSASAERLRDEFIAGDYDLIVIDTLSKLGGITNENDPAQVSAALLAVQHIREAKPGASSLVIHHTDARATKARGASPIRDNVDVLWMMKESGKGFTMTTRSSDGGKMKDAPEERIQGFELREVGDSAVVVWDGKAAPSVNWLPVRDVLADGDWHSGTELRDACGIDEASGQKYKAFTRDLKVWSGKDGLLQKDDSVKRRPRYRLIGADLITGGGN